MNTNFYESLATEEDDDDATAITSNCGNQKQHIKPTT